MQSFPSSRKGQLLQVSAVFVGGLRYFILEALASDFEFPVADFCIADILLCPEIAHDRLSPSEKWLMMV
jgi:hypothetical protein